jgi:hypothetical protein
VQQSTAGTLINLLHFFHIRLDVFEVTFGSTAKVAKPWFTASSFYKAGARTLAMTGEQIAAAATLTC